MVNCIYALTAAQIVCTLWKCTSKIEKKQKRRLPRLQTKGKQLQATQRSIINETDESSENVFLILHSFLHLFDHSLIMIIV